MLHEWDIDVFEFAEHANGSHLVVAVHQVLEDHGLISKFRLSPHKLCTFIRRIQDGYVADNPYHNSVHALDVVLNTNYFLRCKLVDDLITPLDRLAAIIAAALHDFQHPGLNNHFLQSTKHEYAITYNDQSILESHHVASSWKLLLQDECNFLKGLSKDQYLELRDTVIQLVLATDMKFHFECAASPPSRGLAALMRSYEIAASRGLTARPRAPRTRADCGRALSSAPHLY